MAKIVNLRGKKLFPNGQNKYAMTLETADGKPIEAHAGIVICALCKAAGKVYKDRDPSKIIHCPDCNGYGYLIRMMRSDQLEDEHTPPQGPSPKIGA
jgi:DnaJ-class molecular chaperone